jgi:phosphoserine phosphatase
MTKRPDPADGSEATGDLTLETKLWRLAEILMAARRIHSSLSLDDVLSSFLAIAVGEVGGGGGAIYLREAAGDDLRVAHRRLSDEVTARERERCDRLADEALRRNDASIVDRIDDTRTIISLALRDESGTSIGVLQIYGPRDSTLDDGDRLFLKELSHFASLSIRNAQYHRDSLLKARLEREIAVAREIQLGTLPREMPAMPGYDLAGVSRPAEETGGDSFDLVPWGDGGLMALLADATGHGIGPALSVTQVRSMLRLASRLRTDLDEVLRHLNDQLCDDLGDDRFVTAFIGLLEPKEHRVRYHAAGQAPLMHFRSATREFEWAGSTGLPLGIFPATSVNEPNVIHLAPGDTLGLITDGVFEAENAKGEMFGEDRVAATVRKCRSRPCADTIRELLEDVDRHRGAVPQADDITIVLIRRNEST